MDETDSSSVQQSPKSILIISKQTVNAEHRFWASWQKNIKCPCMWNSLMCCWLSRRVWDESECYWGGKGMPRGSVTCPSCRFLTSWASQRLVVESSFSTWANVVSFSWSGRHWRRASLALRDTKYDLYDFWSSLFGLNWNASATQTGFSSLSNCNICAPPTGQQWARNSKTRENIGEKKKYLELSESRK